MIKNEMVVVSEAPDTVEDAFIVSVSYEKWTEEDRDAGECGDRGLVVEREVFDTDDLMACARQYGFSQASASSPAMNPHIWFSTIEPTNDREYFENGVEKFYSLHVHSINGRELESEDFQRIANIIGVKFDNPLVLESKLEPDSETTTLTIG